MNNTIITALMCVVFLLGCSKKVEETSVYDAGKIEETAAFKAACYGGQFKSHLALIEATHQGAQDGYQINQEFKCIDKASYLAMQAKEVELAAYNAPEAVAKRVAEFAKKQALYEEQRARDVAERKLALQQQKPITQAIVTSVDANTATMAELKSVISLDSNAVTQIITAREKQKFGSWNDLIINVTTFTNSARSAVFASTCGLTVNGASFDGAPQDTQICTLIRDKSNNAISAFY